MMRILRTLMHSPLMIVWGCSVHILWGISLLFNVQTTKLVILVGLNKFIEAGLGPAVLAAVLIIVATVALVGLIEEERLGRHWTLALVLPQYFFMVAAFLSDFDFIIVAKNQDTGAHIDRLLLLAILGPVMIAAFLHTISIIERYVVAPRDLVMRLADKE